MASITGQMRTRAIARKTNRLCVGCLRSIDEIAGWGRMTPEERQAVMADVPARAPHLRQRRGGRAARTGSSR